MTVCWVGGEAFEISFPPPRIPALAVSFALGIHRLEQLVLVHGARDALVDLLGRVHLRNL
jgi:hypothetical protein